MTAWWQDLSERERLLLMAGGAVVLLAVLVFLVINPITGFRQDARGEYQSAAETYRRVTLAAAAPRDGASTDAAELRSVLTSSASRSQIVISRLNNLEGAIDLSISATEPARLYGWLAVLEEQHGVHVRSAQIRPATTQGVTARLTLAPGG